MTRQTGQDDRRVRQLGMASMAMTRGAACPRRISMDKTRHDKTEIKTAPVDTTIPKTALLSVTCGPNPLGGVSGGTAGLSQVSPKVFSPFCHRWSFGSLPLSPLACLVGDTSFPAISQYHTRQMTDRCM